MSLPPLPRIPALLICCTAACLATTPATPAAAGGARPEMAPLDVAGFRDSASHWRNIRNETRFIKLEPNQPSYAPNQVREIVANILLFQRENGGWSKDYDGRRISGGWMPSAATAPATPCAAAWSASCAVRSAWTGA